MTETMKHPVPICATVSRKTGKITFEYIDDLQAQIRFGKIMNRINRLAEVFEDEKARKSCADEIRGAASTTL